MRKILLSAIVVISLAAACGGDDDPAVEASDDGTTSSTLTPAPSITTLPGTVDPAATTVTTGAPAAPEDTTPIDPATVETLPPITGDTVPPDPGFPPPALGQYAYHTTGTNSLEGGPVDRPTITTVTSQGENQVRQASDEMVLDIHFRGDGVFVRQLVARMAGQQLTFQSTNGELFVPIPPTEGHTWSWQLTDTTGGLNAAWSATVLPPETISVAGADVSAVKIDATVNLSGRYGGFPVAGTMRLVLWIDPALRVPVKIQQITTATSPFPVNIDTTSVYTGFTPA